MRPVFISGFYWNRSVVFSEVSDSASLAHHFLSFHCRTFPFLLATDTTILGISLGMSLKYQPFNLNMFGFCISLCTAFPLSFLFDFSTPESLPSHPVMH